MPQVDDNSASAFIAALKNLLTASNEAIKAKVFADAEAEFIDPFADADVALDVLDAQNEASGKLLDAAMSDADLAKTLKGIDDAAKNKMDIKEWGEFALEILHVAKKVLLV